MSNIKPNLKLSKCFLTYVISNIGSAWGTTLKAIPLFFYLINIEYNVQNKRIALMYWFMYFNIHKYGLNNVLQLKSL